jgi:hypothetical protein
MSFCPPVSSHSLVGVQSYRHFTRNNLGPAWWLVCQDGLYWTAAAGASESPFEPLVARADSEGYPGKIVRGKTIPYQGYIFAC